MDDNRPGSRVVHARVAGEHPRVAAGLGRERCVVAAGGLGLAALGLAVKRRLQVRGVGGGGVAVRVRVGEPAVAVLRRLRVRILGEVSPDRIKILRNADTIVVDEMKSSGWYYKIWQSFAVLLPVRSVGVMGDERTYDYTIAIRAVESQDGMTADWVKLPYELLEKLSSRIINEVKGVNRACFDITSKPPGTIEWE